MKATTVRPELSSMRYSCILSVALSSLFLLASGNAQVSRRKSIESVEVIGYRRLTETDVRSHIRMRAGQLFTQERSRRDLEEILATGLFNERQTRVVTELGTRGGVVVIFEVVEMQLILNVTFKGRGIEGSDIMKALRAKRINLVKDAVYDPVKVQAARRLIEELLAAHGWPDASVTDIVEELKNPYISIVFEASHRQ